MSKDKQPNPIFERLTRHTNGSSKWVVIVISTGIGLVVLVAALILLGSGNLIFLVTLAIAIISPAVMAIYAANLTSKDLHTENWQMMMLTGIPEETMITGYANAAFHRLRLLAAVATALTPTLIIVSALTMLMIDHRRTSISSFFVFSLPVVILLMFGLWFFQKAAGVLGASLAVWWKRPIPVMIVLSFAMLIIPLLVFISTLWGVSWVLLAIYILLAAVF